MKINIWIPVVVLTIMACNAKKSSSETKVVTGKDTGVTAPTDATVQQGGTVKKDTAAADLNSIGELRLGMSQADLTKLLGDPVSKSKAEEWGADGLMHQDWDYKPKGIHINMSSEKDLSKQVVASITVFKPCSYTTSRNMGIGSPYKEVMAVYQTMIDKTNTDTKTITVGSVYGGIIFTFGKDDRADTVFVGAAAE